MVNKNNNGRPNDIIVDCLHVNLIIGPRRVMYVSLRFGRVLSLFCSCALFRRNS
jgi:hypothetical protein